MLKLRSIGLLFFLASLHASGQAIPTASREADFSAFAGVTGTYTGLSGGKNAGVTGGLDFNFAEGLVIRPSVEVRANVPFDDGYVDSQKSLLGGVRVDARVLRFYPYIDLLAGAGKIRFGRPYTLYSGQLLYSQPASTVLSPGAGLRYSLTPHIAIFGDLQFQRWSTPASLSGHLFAKPFSAGLVYRFGLPQRQIR